MAVKLKEKLSQAQKAARGAEVVALLEAEYPEAVCSLSYGEPWQLLFATRLSAQCTDARVNLVTPVLYARYPTVRALAEADLAEVCDIIRSCGLFRTKAEQIIAGARALLDRFGGEVPSGMDDLLSLPGIGRKTANLIRGDVFGLPAVVADTHCIRLAGRLGLTDSKDPAVVERELAAIIAPEKQNDLCHRFVMHGRAVCDARRPDCGRCCLRGVCPSADLF